MPVRANRALRTSRNMARDGLRMAFPTILGSIPASNSFMWPLSLRMSLLLSARQRTRARSPLGGVEAPRGDKVTPLVTIRPRTGRVQLVVTDMVEPKIRTSNELRGWINLISQGV